MSAKPQRSLIGGGYFWHPLFHAVVDAKTKGAKQTGLLAPFKPKTFFIDAHQKNKGCQKGCKGCQNLLASFFSRYPSHKLSVKHKTPGTLYLNDNYRKNLKGCQKSPGSIREPSSSSPNQERRRAMDPLEGLYRWINDEPPPPKPEGTRTCETCKGAGSIKSSLMSTLCPDCWGFGWHMPQEGEER